MWLKCDMVPSYDGPDDGHDLTETCRPIEFIQDTVIRT